MFQNELVSHIWISTSFCNLLRVWTLISMSFVPQPCRTYNISYLLLTWFSRDLETKLQSPSMVSGWCQYSVDAIFYCRCEPRTPSRRAGLSLDLSLFFSSFSVFFLGSTHAYQASRYPASFSLPLLSGPVHSHQALSSAACRVVQSLVLRYRDIFASVFYFYLWLCIFLPCRKCRRCDSLSGSVHPKIPLCGNTWDYSWQDFLVLWWCEWEGVGSVQWVLRYPLSQSSFLSQSTYAGVCVCETDVYALHMYMHRCKYPTYTTPDFRILCKKLKCFSAWRSAIQLSYAHYNLF